MAQTFGQLSKPLPTLGVIDVNGNCVTQVGFYPKIESAYTLSDILQSPEEIGEEFFLSEKAVERITIAQEAKTKPLTPSLNNTSPAQAKGRTLVSVTKFLK